jgi:beta-glucosidase
MPPPTTFAEARAAVASGRVAEDVAAELVSTLSVDERLWLLDGDAPTHAGLRFMMLDDGYHRAPFGAGALPRIGLPGLAFADGPRGAVIGNATCFPVAMARGATWDPELEERVGAAIGAELRALGATLTGAVCVNLLRHPAWGRAQETYGEDPHHVGEMGAAVVRGLQRHVLACVKHFAANSMENARFQVDVSIDEVALHEVYLPHFRRIVASGAASVMSAYNAVNGEWCGQNRALLTDILRDEWGFEGIVISDWIFGLRDATASVRAGLDIEMPYRMVRAQHLPPALERGELTLADIDLIATRVIATLLRFDGVLSAEPPPRSVVGCDEHRRLAREVAARSVVLLRNAPVEGQPVLPLAPGARLAVFGRLAGIVNTGDHGSSDVWDLDCHPVADGLRARFESVTVDDGTGEVEALASAADAALVVVGFTAADEGEYIGAVPELVELFPSEDEPEVVERYQSELAGLPPATKPAYLSEVSAGFGRGGDRESLRLRPDDVELVRRVASANPRTIVALQAGSAVVVSDWVDVVPALVQCWYGGCRAGEGLADVLAGAVNPSARLPFSVPADEADLPPFDRDATSFTYDRWHGWRHLARTARPAAFPFGFGLSYTTFTLEEVSVRLTTSGPDRVIVASGVVHNSGARDGAEVVQVYASLPDPEAPDRLVGFARIDVPAGGRAAFEIAVPVDRLARRDPDAHAWQPATGIHRVRVARWASDPDASEAEVELPGA